MRTDDLHRSLDALFGELVDGAGEGAAFTLNRGDAGLLSSLDRLSADAASRSSQGGATVAAHVAHLRDGFALLNRWAAGEDLSGAVDWSAAWRIASVTEAEWADLRRGLRDQVERWREALRSPREVSGVELDNVLSSVIHLGYHFGAMRQIAPPLRGPRERP